MLCNLLLESSLDQSRQLDENNNKYPQIWLRYVFFKDL